MQFRNLARRLSRRIQRSDLTVLLGSWVCFSILFQSIYWSIPIAVGFLIMARIEYKVAVYNLQNDTPIIIPKKQVKLDEDWDRKEGTEHRIGKGN